MDRTVLVAIVFGLLAPAAIVEQSARAGEPTERPAADHEFFERQVRPLLANHCWECHGEKKQEAGLRLDSPQHLMRGGDEGPVIAVGEPSKSKLVTAVEYAGEIKMPPAGKLPPEAIATLSAWIRDGAVWPATAPNRGPADTLDQKAKAHWAFQPIRTPAEPPVANRGWLRTPVDAFVLAKLEARGLSPAQPADRRTLIRRISFDLTGLPPTPEEVDEFVNDPAADADARLIDRLLASPRYGERWGRHWLDLARYADTKGYVFQEDRNYPFAWVYRDWVVRALNQDLGYDQFLICQLAADRQSADASQPNPDLAALGFLTVGRRFLNNKYDIIDDRIDVVTRTTMGLTVGCARCHDHKFDPIPAADYYSLFGVFDASVERLLPLTQPSSDFEAGVREREGKLKNYLEEQKTASEGALRRQTADFLLASRLPKVTDDNLLRRDRKRRMAQRWRDYLEKRSATFDPLFEPWKLFAAIPDNEFASKSAELAMGFAKNEEPERRLNPRVAGLFAQPPASIDELAARYGALFDQVDEEWKRSVDAARQAQAAPPTSLPDADAEQLRQVLYASDSPLVLTGDGIERAFEKPVRDELKRLREDLANFRATSKDAPVQAMGLHDANPIEPKTRILVRGNPSRPGAEVPRQFLALVAGPQRKPFEHGSGRLDLAKAIVAPDNPLTARVLVNRVWALHFGQGLVRTPSDFGLRSDPPSHPELLDYLAARFMAEGWSLKKLHRWILLSNTYQQKSDDRPEARAVDPENLLLWRMNRRRLDLEALRDSLLYAAGQLDESVGGPAVDIVGPGYSKRRTLYGRVERQNLPGMFRTFDFASPDSHSPQRFVTIVPQQGLFLMNSPFAVDQAKRLVQRPEMAAAEPPQRLTRLYRLLYGRAPDSEEALLATQYLEQPLEEAASGGASEPKIEASDRWTLLAQALLLSNEFVFVD